MTFLIDAQVMGSFIREPTGDGSFEYNILVFANDSLPYGKHTLTIMNGHTDGPKSLILLDYIIYS
jgi:hypothetical protein